MFHTPNAPGFHPSPRHYNLPQWRSEYMEHELPEQAHRQGDQRHQEQPQHHDMGTWGHSGVFFYTGGWDVSTTQTAPAVGARWEQQERQSQQPRWTYKTKKRRSRSHKGELGTMIPNIPTIAPLDQHTASRDLLREIFACVCMEWMTCGLWPTSFSYHAKLFATVNIPAGSLQPWSPCWPE